MQSSEEYFYTDEDSTKSPESEENLSNNKEIKTELEIDIESAQDFGAVSSENNKEVKTELETDIESTQDFGALPLEVITTVEPTNLEYNGHGNQTLKKLSNGVLTVRNIFSLHEREALRKIIEKYRYIVDTRSRTREIYIEKQNVWEQIVDEYNRTENIVSRTQKELRKCWDNMKYRAKQAEKESKPVTDDIKLEVESNAFVGEDLAKLTNEALQSAMNQLCTSQKNVPDKQLSEESAQQIMASSVKQELQENIEDNRNHHVKSGKFTLIF